MGIAAKLKKFPRLYSRYREAKIYWSEIKILRDEAIEKFAEEKTPLDHYAIYKPALFRHRFSYNEYKHCYKLWDKSRKQRRQYISEKEMRCIYRKTVMKTFNNCCSNKEQLLDTFKTFINRKWIFPRETTIETFKAFVSSHDCIAKPQNGSLGKGIFFIRKEEDGGWQKLFDDCVKNNLIVEERIRSCREIEAFHPQSLNTIRVFTISKGNRCELVAAEFRVGVGDSVVDNVSAGGIFAPIDIDTGVIFDDGADRLGHIFKSHPDSGKTFKGFVIPSWEKIVDTCKRMSTIVIETAFAGWDICVLPNGEAEMIEVNSCPNVTGLQTAYKKGLKQKIRTIGIAVLGYDPIKLIPFWSKSYVKHGDV